MFKNASKHDLLLVVLIKTISKRNKRLLFYVIYKHKYIYVQCYATWPRICSITDMLTGAQGGKMLQGCKGALNTIAVVRSNKLAFNLLQVT